MGSRLLNSYSAVRASLATLGPKPRSGAALSTLAILGCLLPVPAAAYVDYGFSVVDNSAGGTIMDNYITQELWADTDLQWTGTHLRLELENGSIFQDTTGGSGFITEYNHDLLASAIDQPSLSFDTRVSLNGVAPLIYGGAINIGGAKEVHFTDDYLNIAYGHGGGEYHTGAFNFGTLTLSNDAIGHGALMFSMHGEQEGGFYAQMFEVDRGVIRLTGERVNLEDPNYNYTLENWQFVRHEIPRRPPEPEPQPEPPAPDPPVMPPDPPVVILPPVIEPDPIPQPEPLPEPVENPTEPPHSDPGETILLPDNPIGRVIRVRYFEVPDGGIEDMLRLPVLFPHDFGSEVLILDDGVPLLFRDPEFDSTLPPGSEIVFHKGGSVTELDAELRSTNRGVTRFIEFAQPLGDTSSQILTTAIWGNSGDVFVPLSALSDAQRTSLLETGHWTLQGDFLLYSGPAGVPEPASVVLVLLATAMACYWRCRK